MVVLTVLRLLPSAGQPKYDSFELNFILYIWNCAYGGPRLRSRADFCRKAAEDSESLRHAPPEELGQVQFVESATS